MSLFLPDAISRSFFHRVHLLLLCVHCLFHGRQRTSRSNEVTAATAVTAGNSLQNHS